MELSALKFETPILLQPSDRTYAFDALTLLAYNVEIKVLLAIKFETPILLQPSDVTYAFDALRLLE
jgi:competence transcription factor ComK